ncbi:MAG: hypothetical protein WAM04_20990 [Candidatus Sulfotelmatobacter sp.]
MPLQTSLPESRHSRGTSQFRPKFAWAMGICAAILVCAVAIPRLAAQTDAGAQTKSNPCEEPELKPAPKCVVSPPQDAKPASDAKPPSNDTDYVQAALASEWLNKDKLDGTNHVLDALTWLTCSSLDPDVLNAKTICKTSDKDKPVWQPPGVFLHVLQELEKGVKDPRNNSVCKRDKTVYQWALGQPDDEGQTAAGMANFIDTVAKANTLGIKGKTKDEQDLPKSELFACTSKIVGDVYDSPQGLLNIPQINTYYGGGTYARYLGLILLLENVRAADGTCDDDCAERMEKLRAAFELDADRLGSQIAAKVSAPPKQ